MAVDAQELTISATSWSGDIEDMFRECAGPGGLDDIREQVLKGAAVLFGVSEGGQQVGAMALRVDDMRTGPEAVLVGMAWLPGRLDIAVPMMRGAEKICAQCVSLRVHTIRPALARMLARDGFHACELVVRKQLKGAHHVRVE